MTTIECFSVLCQDIQNSALQNLQYNADHSYTQAYPRILSQIFIVQHFVWTVSTSSIQGLKYTKKDNSSYNTLFLYFPVYRAPYHRMTLMRTVKRIPIGSFPPHTFQGPLPRSKVLHVSPTPVKMVHFGSSKVTFRSANAPFQSPMSTSCRG